MTEAHDVTQDADVPGGELEVLPPARVPDMAAIATLHEHVGAMRDAKFFAEGMCYTALVPDRFRGKPGDGAAAILYGAELGLSPVASLRSVIVIHGQPGLEARTMKALLKAKGYRFKTYESTDEACDIEAWSPDGSESERCRFTIDDARKADWVPVEVKPGEYKKNANGKLAGNMKYITEPRTMLRAKATAVVCREIAPHILLGMPYSVDELTSEDWSANETSAPVRVASRRRGLDGLRQALDEEPLNVEEERPEEDSGQGGRNDAGDDVEPSSGITSQDPPRDQRAMAESTRRKWLNRMFQLLSEADCTDRDDQLIVIAAAAGLPIGSLDHRDDLDDEQLRTVVNRLNEWQKGGTLGETVTATLNNATLAEADRDIESTQAQDDGR